jgi:hypothetical protein
MEVLEFLADRRIAGRIVEFSGHPNDMHTTHCVVEAEGQIVDVTFGQFDPTAPWPIVEPADVYANRFAHGPDPVEILERCESSGLDVDAIRAEWSRLGITQR